MDLSVTTRAQDALSNAVRRASRSGHAQVEPLHLLDSLLQQGEGIATALLSAVGADVRALTAQVRSALGALPSASGSSMSAPQLSQAALRVVNAAQALAKERGDEYVSTEHLLIALASDGGPGVADRLAQSHSALTTGGKAMRRDGSKKTIQLVERDARKSFGMRAEC